MNQNKDKYIEDLEQEVHDLFNEKMILLKRIEQLEKKIEEMKDVEG